MMKKIDLKLPEFLLGEYPIKDDSINDQRQFIIHRGVSLIEVISHDELTHIIFDEKLTKQFTYFGEDFSLTYHTNNSSHFNIKPLVLLDKAWDWYREYLIWEDTQ